MDEDIIAAFACNETIALCPVEPLDCTVDTFRHFCLLGNKKNMEGTHWVLHRSRLNGGENKAAHGRSVSQLGTSKANYWYPTAGRISWGWIAVNEKSGYW
jgi:hypothetical protein